MYRIVWTSGLTGNKGYGSWITDREEADAWVKAMNAQGHATRWSVEENNDLDLVAEEITRELLMRLTLGTYKYESGE